MWCFFISSKKARRFFTAASAAWVERIYARVLAWLRKQGLARSEDEAELDAEANPLCPMEGLVRLGMGRGELRTTREGEDDATSDEPSPRPPAAQGAVSYRRLPPARRSGPCGPRRCGARAPLPLSDAPSVFRRAAALAT